MDEKTTLQSTNHQNITIRATGGDLHGNAMSCTQALTTDSLSQCPVSGSCNVPQPPTILSSDLCELACKFEGESLIKVDTMLAEPCEYLEEVSVFDVDADDGGERSHPGLVDGGVELDEPVPTLAADRSGHPEKTLVGDDSPDEDDGHQTLKEVSLRGNEESKDARMNLLDATPFLMSEGGVIFQCFPLSEKDFFIVSLEDDTLLMNEPLTEDHLPIAAEASSDLRVGNLGEDSIKQGGHIMVGTELGSGPHFPSLEATRADACIQNIPTSSLMTSSYNDCESSYDPQETRVATNIISSEIAGPSTDFGNRSQFVTANTTDSVVMARRKIKASPVLKDDEQPQKELMKVTHATIYASAPRRMRKAPTDSEEISSELYKCFVCNDALPTSLTLRHHLVTKHQQSNFDSFMCFLCEQECWSASQEEWHLRIQHSIKNKALACPVCGTQFSIQTECRAHIRKHSVNLTCPSCPQKFAAQHQLTQHVKQHLEEIQPYSCLQCDIRFTHPRVLEIHTWRHRSQNCPEDSCEYAAEDESWLMYHLQDHHKYTAQSVRSLVAARNSADYKMDVLLLKYYQIQKDKLKSQSSDARGLTLTASEVHATGERNPPLASGIEKNDNLAGNLLKDTSECARDERVDDSSSVLGDILETVVITQEEKKKNVKRKEEVLRKVFDGGTPMHRCGLCNTYHSSLEELAVHKAEHNQVLECIKCQRSFLSVKQLKRHMTVHNSSKDDQKQTNKDKGMNEHRCLVCGKMYGSESALSRHSSIHGRSEGHHQCKICLRRVRTKAHLTEHMSRVHKAHSDSEKVQCPMCNGKFSSNFHLTLHVMNHEETKPMYSCKTCNRSYVRPRSLRRHMDAHSQTFVCDTCNETFPSAHRLAVHARGHDPLYKSKVPCPRCPATFPYKSQMEVHLRTHTGEKPYVCETCGKCFKRLQHCKTHHKVMHGNEKFPCSECGKPFTDKTNLLRHRLKVHYHLNRWVCGVCAHSYAYSADLRHHLKRKHDVEFQRLDHAYKKCMSEVYVIPELGTQEISKSTRAAIEYICEIEKQKVKQIYSGIVPDLKRPVQKNEIGSNNDPDDPVPSQGDENNVDASRSVFIPAAQVVLPTAVGNGQLRTGGQTNPNFQTFVTGEVQGLMPLQVAGVKCAECGVDVANPQQCGACGIMVCSQAHMDVHAASVHHVLFQCSVCGLRYSSQSECVAHVTASHSSHLLAVQGGAPTYLAAGQTQTIQSSSTAVPPQLCLPLPHSQPNPQCLLQVGGCPPQMPVAIAPAPTNVTSQQMAPPNCVLQYPNIVSGVPSGIPVIPQTTALETVNHHLGKQMVFAMTNVFPPNQQHPPSGGTQPGITHLVKKPETLAGTSLCTITLPNNSPESLLIPSNNNNNNNGVVTLSIKPNSNMLPTILPRPNNTHEMSSIVVGNSELSEQRGDSSSTSVLLVDSVPVPNASGEVSNVLPSHKVNSQMSLRSHQTNTSVASVLLTLAETPQDDQSSVFVPDSTLRITDRQLEPDLSQSLVSDASLGQAKKEVLNSSGNSGLLQSIVELPDQDKEEQIQRTSLSLSEDMQVMETSRDGRPPQEISVEIVQPQILNTNPESKISHPSPKKPASRSKRKRTSDCAKNKVHECATCGKTFSLNAQLKKHQATHGVRRFKCQVCSKAFTEKYNLKIHTLTHTQERPHECNLCRKSFRYLRDLAEHKRMHEGTRPYVCDVCQKAFIRQRDLTRHQKEQHDTKRYQCKVCGLPFKRRLYLKTVHMRIHHPLLIEANDEGKPKENVPTKSETKQSHICKICGRNFARARYLTSHLRIHSKRADYVRCPVCPRMFTSEQTLKVHRETFHNHELSLQDAGTEQKFSQEECMMPYFDQSQTENVTSNRTSTSHAQSSRHGILLPPINLPTAVQPAYSGAIGRSEEVPIQSDRIVHFSVNMDDCEAITHLPSSFSS